ncbi:Uncharacterised protein [Mycobacterium tuberculosis]|nr:Uncharacterised protein [Mycobacterium tuberculosis]
MSIVIIILVSMDDTGSSSPKVGRRGSPAGHRRAAMPAVRCEAAQASAGSRRGPGVKRAGMDWKPTLVPCWG